MNLFGQWKELTDRKMAPDEYNSFWNTYLEKEKNIYEDILENKKRVISGKLAEVAESYNMDEATFTGFIDGINTSLLEPVDLEKLTEDSELKLEIDFEKLYWNMLDAKAEWLYNLPQWENILTEEKRQEIRKEYNRSKIAVSTKVGRNDPCPCGSGKKYKKCCGR
ncbi:MAG: SEC-C metal-binding domain-containing protein [Acetivibrionales bacterium]|jgi:hypothetical protein